MDADFIKGLLVKLGVIAGGVVFIICLFLVTPWLLLALPFVALGVCAAAGARS